jgi:ribonuclease BN (tRNA processing enzyme)
VPEPLEIVPVGVGAAYAAPGEAQSSYFVRHGGTRVLLDLGAGALNRLMPLVPPEDLDLVLITHLHPDHMIDLLSLRVYMAWGPGAGRPIRVAGPDGLRARLAAHGEEGLDAAFTFEVLDRGGGTLTAGEGVSVTYRQVPHLEPTFAVRVEAGGRTLVYGADSAPDPGLARFAEGADLVLLECSFGDGAVPEGVPHLTARDAAAIARDAGAGRLLMTHVYPEFDRDASLRAAREVFPATDWARQDERVAV